MRCASEFVYNPSGSDSAICYIRSDCDLRFAVRRCREIYVQRWTVNDEVLTRLGRRFFALSKVRCHLISSYLILSPPI